MTTNDIRYIATDSETDAIVCADTNFGYVKQVLPETKIKIVDPAFLKPVEIGTPGELLVSSDPMVATYLNKPEETHSACVVGVPDERVGERIKAYVVLKEDIKGITGYDLISWCRKTLVSYKIPQYIEFRDMLPKSKVGKLLRREIRDEESRRAET